MLPRKPYEKRSMVAGGGDRGYKDGEDGPTAKRKPPQPRRTVDYSGPMLRYVVERKCCFVRASRATAAALACRSLSPRSRPRSPQMLRLCQITLLLAALCCAAGFHAPATAPRALGVAARARSAFAGAVARPSASRSSFAMIRPDEEPSEAFLSSWEKKPDGEKLKSPAVLIGLGAILLPFIVGIIVLGTGGFGN